jgi:hypothetical protein
MAQHGLQTAHSFTRLQLLSSSIINHILQPSNTNLGRLPQHCIEQDVVLRAYLHCSGPAAVTRARA